MTVSSRYNLLLCLNLFNIVSLFVHNVFQVATTLVYSAVQFRAYTVTEVSLSNCPFLNLLFTNPVTVAPKNIILARYLSPYTCAITNRPTQWYSEIVRGIIVTLGGNVFSWLDSPG
jgi:hypothetical protein